MALALLFIRVVSDWTNLKDGTEVETTGYHPVGKRSIDDPTAFKGHHRDSQRRWRCFLRKAKL